MELKKKIYSIVDEVFSCKFTNIPSFTLEIAEYIEKNRVFLNKESKNKWNEILYYLMIALENKDYLMVSDILKYELEPILPKEN